MTRKKAAFYFLAILLVAFGLRFPSLLVSFVNIDENEYALAAHIINSGGIPYKDFLIYQPPGIYYLYAGVFKFFSAGGLMEDKMWWVHLVMIGIVMATCWAIYRVGKVVFEDRLDAFVAAFFYAIFSTTFLPQDMLGANIELLMVLPMTLACLFFLKGEKNFSFYFLSGIFLGLSILCKYQGGILLAAFLLYLFSTQSLKKTILAAASMMASSALLIGLWAFYLHRHEALDDAVRCFLYILDYAKGPPGSDWLYVSLKFLLRTSLMFFSGFVLWYFALRSVFSSLKNLKSTPKKELFLVIWFFVSFIPVLVGGRMYFHYFLLVFPALSLLGAIGWRRFYDSLKQLPIEKSLFKWTLFIGAIFIPVVGFTAYATYKPFRPKHKDNWIYVVDYIREHTQKSDPIFVWGYCPQIYTISNRYPTTRFTTADYLTGRTPKTAGLEFDPNSKNPPSVFKKLAMDFTTPKEVIEYDTSENIFPGAMELLMEDFAKYPPELIVDTAPSNYRLYGRYPIKKFPRLEEFVQKNYRLETNVYNMDIYRRQK